MYWNVRNENKKSGSFSSLFLKTRVVGDDEVWEEAGIYIATAKQPPIRQGAKASIRSIRPILSFCLHLRNEELI